MWLYNISSPAADGMKAIDPIIFYIYCAVTGIALILFVISLAVVGCGCGKWGFMSVIDQSIMAGGLMLAATVLARGVPYSMWTDEAFELVCQIYPAPLTLGLSYVIGGLLIKAASIVDHYYTVEKSKRPFRLWKPALGMFILLLIDAAVVIVWSILYRNRSEHVMNDHYACLTTEKNEVAKNAFEWSILGYHAALLLAAAVMVWPALYKVISGPASTETKFTTFIVYNIFLACVVPGVVIHFLLYHQGRISGTVYYAVMGGLTLYGVVSTIVLLIFSQGIVGAYRKRKSEEL